MQSQESQSDGAIRRLVARNTLYLTASQALTVPLAIVVNAVLARKLGAQDFGELYLAATLATFGFLLINWGHEGALPALIATQRPRAAAFIGTSFLWRIAVSIVVYPVLAVACWVLHYGPGFQWVLGLTFLVNLLTALVSALKDSVRGFERTDIPAVAQVGQQLLVALCVVPVILLGGGVRSSLVAQVPAGVIALILLWRALASVGVRRLSVDREAGKALFAGGTPFLFFGLAMALQPNIDAVYLSKLAPTDVMGWYAVSRRLIGVLIFPAVALIGALYPTLCRLYASDFSNFVSVARSALQGVALFVVPVALGCALYPEIGVSIFSTKAFGHAESNLRVLAPFLFLVYVSMPLGCCIMAAGKQRPWSVVQAFCVVVSLVLDPLLVPWFQARQGNGGMGLCVATVVSEVLVVVSGMVLAPKGILDRSFFRSMVPAAGAGAAMVAVAWLLRPLNAFFSAPLAVMAYVAVLWLTGGISKEQVDAVRGFFARKFSRPRAT